MKWEADQDADKEIRRDRIILVAANTENSQKIFQMFKTKEERKRQDASPFDGVPDEYIQETSDPEITQVLEQMKSHGMAIQEI